MLNLIKATAVLAILGLGLWFSTEHRQLQTEIQVERVELQNAQTELNQLQLDYEHLNSDLTEALESNETTQEQLDTLRNEKQRLEREKQRLEAELQAKRNATQLKKRNVAYAAEPTSNVEQIVRQAAIDHGLNPDWFVRLAMCESSMNPNAVNYNYYENGHPSGLFQHISGYWPARAAQHGYAGSSVFDPVANANVTAAMWENGSHLWECQ